MEHAGVGFGAASKALLFRPIGGGAGPDERPQPSTSAAPLVRRRNLLRVAARVADHFTPNAELRGVRSERTSAEAMAPPTPHRAG
jgi:hypothetical protein